jgi:hypothetical protein
MLSDLEKIIRQKKFIYKDAKWDDNTSLILRDGYDENSSEISKSRTYIINEIPNYKDEKEKYDLDNNCRYVHYLSNKLIILNREIHISIEKAQKKPELPSFIEVVEKKQELPSFIEVVEKKQELPVLIEKPEIKKKNSHPLKKFSIHRRTHRKAPNKRISKRIASIIGK